MATSTEHRASTQLPTSPPVLVIGASGHAKVVIELVRAAGAYEIIGLIDLNLSGAAILGVPILGTDEDLPRLRREGIAHAFVGIGNNQRRLKTSYYLRKIGFKIINAISPAAIISPSARLGDGIAVMPGAVINAEGRIDDFSIINTHASVDHDCWIGAGAHVCPGSTLAGNVRVGSLAFIGAGATVVPGITIGQNATIGAGASVLRDVPDGASAWGVPARIMRRNH